MNQTATLLNDKLSNRGVENTDPQKVNCMEVLFPADTCCTFKNRTLREYQTLLFLVSIMHIFCAAVEGWIVWTIFSDKTPVSMTLKGLCLLAATLAFINSIIAHVMIKKLSKNLCIFSGLVVFAVGTLFVVQIVLDDSYNRSIDLQFLLVFIANILQIFFQAFALIILYRYWQYLMYNHEFSDDESEWSRASSVNRLADDNDLTAPLRAAAVASALSQSSSSFHSNNSSARFSYNSNSASAGSSGSHENNIRRVMSSPSFKSSPRNNVDDFP